MSAAASIILDSESNHKTENCSIQTAKAAVFALFNSLHDSFSDLGTKIIKVVRVEAIHTHQIPLSSPLPKLVENTERNVTMTYKVKLIIL